MSRFCILILLFKPDEIKRNKKGYPAYNKENMNLITYLEKESNEEQKKELIKRVWRKNKRIACVKKLCQGI